LSLRHSAVHVAGHHWKHLVVLFGTVLWWLARRIRMAWLEQLALTIVIAVLSQVIKNPASHAGMITVLTHIRDDACTAVLALDPSAPDPPGYKKA